MLPDLVGNNVYEGEIRVLKNEINMVFDISDDNYEDVRDYFYNFDREKVFSKINLINIVSSLRPTDIRLFDNFIYDTIEKYNFDYPLYLLKPTMILRLFEKGLFDKDYILRFYYASSDTYRFYKLFSFLISAVIGRVQDKVEGIDYGDDELSADGYRIIKEYYRYGFPVNSIGSYIKADDVAGLSAMHLDKDVANKHVYCLDIYETLLHFKYSATTYSFSPLALCIYYRSNKCLELLKGKGAVYTEDCAITALMIGDYGLYTEINIPVKDCFDYALLSHNFETLKRLKYSEQCLFKVVSTLNIDYLRHIVSAKDVDLNVTIESCPLLLYAVKTSQVELLDYLLHNGAAIDARDDIICLLYKEIARFLSRLLLVVTQ